MVNISYLVRKTDNVPLQCSRIAGGTVVQYPVPDLPGQVQSLSLLFQHLHHPQSLTGMGEASGNQSV